MYNRTFAYLCLAYLFIFFCLACSVYRGYQAFRIRQSLLQATPHNYLPKT